VGEEGEEEYFAKVLLGGANASSLGKRLQVGGGEEFRFFFGESAISVATPLHPPAKRSRGKKGRAKQLTGRKGGISDQSTV